MKPEDWKNVIPKTPASFEESLKKTLESIKTPVSNEDNSNKAIDAIDRRSNRRHRLGIIILIVSLFLVTIFLLSIIIMHK